MITFVNQHLPAIGIGAIGVLILVLLAKMSHRKQERDDSALLPQLLGWIVGLVFLVAVIAALPISDSVRGQILSLLGVVITAIIALSSTTFVSNAMAGVLLQSTKPFRPGDFIQVDGVFGRVTHRALVHTRVQTETRDFITLPNMLLVNTPVTVLHREGTSIQIDVSLGYDRHHYEIESLLKQAALSAGLEEPYVLIVDLLDHAINYRVAGFVSELRNPIAERSKLRVQVLNTLHEADIEITSPQVVAQRQQTGDTRTLPDHIVQAADRHTEDDLNVSKVFDIAEAAANAEQLKQNIADTEGAIADQQKVIKAADEDRRHAEQVTLDRLKQKLKWLEAEQAEHAKS